MYLARQFKRHLDLNDENGKQVNIVHKKLQEEKKMVAEALHLYRNIRDVHNQIHK